MGEVAKYLINSHGWYEGIANALERSRGLCEYCRENLLATRPGYSSIVMDHLLPKSIYPDVEWNLNNHALACSSCNAMKGKYDPLEKNEDPVEMVLEQREELVKRVQVHLSESIEKRTQEWKSIRDKFHS